MGRMIYLDNNATTRTRPEVVEAMLPYFTETYGNASSVHAFGRAARVAIDQGRMQVAALLGAASPEEVVFTSGGTESDNLAIMGVAGALKAKGNHIITCSIEHSAILKTCAFLEKRGCAVTYVRVGRDGIIDLDELKEAITDKTVLISVMYANNEVGTIEPVAEIAGIAKECGITFHTDAIQAFGKIPFDVKTLGADLVSVSAHKLYGPKGVGALYIKKGTKITPEMHGGSHEMNKRPGTENVTGIVGFGVAAAWAGKEMSAQSKRLTELRDYFFTALTAAISDVSLNGHWTQRLPNTLNVGFKYLEGESILLNLDMKGIAASTGSACTSGSLEPSHVLTGMGIDPADAQGSIRFSMSRETTKDDIDHVVKVLPPIIQRLRDMSPLYDKK